MSDEYVTWHTADEGMHQMLMLLEGGGYSGVSIRIFDIMVALGKITYGWEVSMVNPEQTTMKESDMRRDVIDAIVRDAVIDKMKREMDIYLNDQNLEIKQESEEKKGIIF